MKLAYMITGTTITVMYDGKTKVVNLTHANYMAVKESLMSGHHDDVPDLIDIVESIKSYTDGDICIDGGVLRYKGTIIQNSFATRIVDMKAKGYDVSSLIKFLDNLMENPSMQSVDELYEFLECSALPITDDGHFLAYKAVKNNGKGKFVDFHTKSIDNSVGAVCEMPRNQVDDRRDNTCSRGLHFCSLSYLSVFGTSDTSITVIVKINPRDVVSIPSDYNNAKGRACRYEVVDIHKEDNVTEAFDEPVVSEYSGDGTSETFDRHVIDEEYLAHIYFDDDDGTICMEDVLSKPSDVNYIFMWAATVEGDTFWRDVSVCGTLEEPARSILEKMFEVFYHGDIEKPEKPTVSLIEDFKTAKPEMSKPYSTAYNARRAAKSRGLVDFEITNDDTGHHFWITK